MTQLQPASYSPVASTRVCPWVTSFRNARLAEAMKLAAIIGHGAAADEVFAMAGDESSYGCSDKATVHESYFGIHSNGATPANVLPGHDIVRQGRLHRRQQFVDLERRPRSSSPTRRGRVLASRSGLRRPPPQSSHLAGTP